ncbi:MAG: bifunctional UDP-N-acetylglucosamine diphosphorylase/glucosamine-1-phosphate N-acetyltransferase GlmU [Gammaproteobacteria bacterium]
MSLSIIILAAGQGTRMRSALPKVLHCLAGKTLLEHVYTAAMRLEHNGIHVVYGYGGRQVPDSLPHLDVNWVEQQQQLGTGHAVQQAIGAIPASDRVLILYGDIPLITRQTLQRLVDASRESGFSLMTSCLDDPSGYGRIVRDGKGDVTAIVEEKDADEKQLAIGEINTGMMTVDAGKLGQWLDSLDSRNSQGEYYLTDVISMAVADGVKVHTMQPESPDEIRGINNRVQLAEIERYYQLVQARHLMLQGVSLMDPSRFDLRGDLTTGRDVTIDVNVVIEGSVSIGDNVVIGPNCYINNADIGSDVTILPDTVIEDAVLGDHCRIGPFARIRPQTRLAEGVHIGNFVEIKNAEVGRDSKVNHLSYVGDSDIGKNVNIGAGTITCNYDGANKHRTVIEDDVHIGSDTQLVAPVRIGAGATVGAGTTVTKDVKAGSLVHNKTDWRTVSGWKRPGKNK